MKNWNNKEHIIAMAVQNLNQIDYEIWFIKGKRGGQSEEELFFSPV